MKDPMFMTKKELVSLGARLGLGSKAALDAKYIEQVRSMVREALQERE